MKRAREARRSRPQVRRRGLRRPRRRVRARGAAGRTAAVDRDPPALDRRDRARRGRGPQRARAPRSPASRCSRSAAGRRRAMFESGYFAVRAALAKSVSDSARFVAAQGLGAQSAPGGRAAHLPDRRPIRGGRQREDRGAGGAGARRDRRRGGQRRLRRALPDAGARSFHRAPARAAAWAEPRRFRIPAPQGRGGARLSAGFTRRWRARNRPNPCRRPSGSPSPAGAAPAPSTRTCCGRPPCPDRDAAPSTIAPSLTTLSTTITVPGRDRRSAQPR